MARPRAKTSQALVRVLVLVLERRGVARPWGRSRGFGVCLGRGFGPMPTHCEFDESEQALTRDLLVDFATEQPVEDERDGEREREANDDEDVHEGQRGRADGQGVARADRLPHKGRVVRGKLSAVCVVRGKLSAVCVVRGKMSAVCVVRGKRSSSA